MSSSSTRSRNFTLAGVIRSGVSAALAEVHTACAARVVRYDATKQLADLQPLVMVHYLDETGETVSEALPVCVNVPVIFPGGGGFRLTFPIKADPLTGDTAVLLFAEHSLDSWLALGGNGVEPNDERRFHLSDAMAFVGLRDFAHALASARPDAMTLGDDVGLQIHIDKSHVQIGTKDPTLLEAAALGATLQSFLTAAQAWMAGHTHPAAGVLAPAGTAGGACSGTVGPPAAGPPAVPVVTSSHVQVMK